MDVEEKPKQQKKCKEESILIYTIFIVGISG
jgi:hypothetical protein